MGELPDDSWKDASSVYDFTCKDIKGNDISLRDYEGKVLLIVNVASKCGYTLNNYKELIRFNELYHGFGLRILAFPCNQFGKQEPGSNEVISKFIERKNVNFTVFGKVKVNGTDANPLWKYLKHKVVDPKGEVHIKWNFTKFIVDKEGQPRERFGPITSFDLLWEALDKYW